LNYVLIGLGCGIIYPPLYLMQLQVFKYEEENTLSNLTTVEIDGEDWFVANEVCALLDIRNSRDAISRLDDDEKLTSVIPTSGQNRAVNLINESGLTC